MKTPLSHDILRDWKLMEAPHHSLTVQDLLAAQTASGRHVGLIIDLTNHDCLYEEDVPAEVS
jgi:alpha-glucan,water dikinase